MLAKIKTFLGNIESDINRAETNNFETVKSFFAPKYKNLPVKFHFYLDEAIKWKMKENNQ